MNETTTKTIDTTTTTRNTDPNRFSVCTTGKYVWLWQWRTLPETASYVVYTDVRDIPSNVPCERLRVTPGTGERNWIPETD
jgi:hypothetical protein